MNGMFFFLLKLMVKAFPMMCVVLQFDNLISYGLSRFSVYFRF